MLCRCDIYSTHLKEAGFRNLYTLEGGVQRYLAERGSHGWQGSLFTFDSRMAITAGGCGASTLIHLCCITLATCTSRGLADGLQSHQAVSLATDGHTSYVLVLTSYELAEGQLGQGSPAAAACLHCGEPAQLPHINCANIDCNDLFLTCPSCRVRVSLFSGLSLLTVSCAAPEHSWTPRSCPRKPAAVISHHVLPAGALQRLLQRGVRLQRTTLPAASDAGRLCTLARPARGP